MNKPIISLLPAVSSSLAAFFGYGQAPMMCDRTHSGLVPTRDNGRTAAANIIRRGTVLSAHAKPVVPLRGQVSIGQSSDTPSDILC